MFFFEDTVVACLARTEFKPMIVEVGEGIVDFKKNITGANRALVSDNFNTVKWNFFHVNTCICRSF